METELKYEQSQDLSAEEMYRLFLNGDENSFESLVVLYENELGRFIYNIVHDYHEAKHLTIEAFAQLAASGRQFAGRSSIKTYLFTIGKNLAIRYMKMVGNIQHYSFEEVIEISDDENETPDHFLEQEENKRLLREAMVGLKDEHRVVLLLLYFEDMSYLQAGQVMQKSEKQIKHLAYRAKLALRKKLENGGFVPSS